MKAPERDDVRRRNQQSVASFLALLQQGDIDGWAALWHEDGRSEYPFAPEWFPSGVQGRETLRAHYAAAISSRKWRRYTISHVYPLEDPDWVAVEFQGESELKDSGKIYRNRYFALFQFREGAIVCFREYFDPLQLLSVHGDARTAAASYQRKD